MNQTEYKRRDSHCEKRCQANSSGAFAHGLGLPAKCTITKNALPQATLFSTSGTDWKRAIRLTHSFSDRASYRRRKIKSFSKCCRRHSPQDERRTRGELGIHRSPDGAGFDPLVPTCRDLPITQTQRPVEIGAPDGNRTH